MVVVIKSPVKDMIINKAIDTSERGTGELVMAVWQLAQALRLAGCRYAKHPEELTVVEVDFVEQGWPNPQRFTGGGARLDCAPT